MLRLKKALEKLSIEYTEKQIDQVEKYMKAVLKANESINLTAIKNEEEFIAKHLVDSMWAAYYKEFKDAENIVDIGTGAGFPGIPLSVFFPDKKFLLVDSLNKKLKIIERTASELEINNIKVLHMRAEDMGRDLGYREKFDVCVSRAVANMSTLSEYCLPLVRVGGVFIAYKTLGATEEISDAKKAVELLGGRYSDKDNYIPHNTEESGHMTVKIDKIKKTSGKYPRDKNVPRKNPL